MPGAGLVEFLKMREALFVEGSSHGGSVTSYHHRSLIEDLYAL